MLVVELVLYVVFLLFPLDRSRTSDSILRRRILHLHYLLLP
jgi:hypothetical protein